MVPEDDDYYGSRQIEDDEEKRADLITIHIYKDQIVKLTEDVIRWMFHKVKGLFRKKKKEHKANEGGNAGDKDD